MHTKTVPDKELFQRSVAVLKQATPFKLVKPGLFRFLHRIIARKRSEPTILQTELFWGGKMHVVLPEVISEAIYTYGFFDEEVTAMVLHAVRPGDIVLDIGAHFGYFTLLLSHLVGDKGKVLAFEPTPSTFEVLKLNKLKADNIRIFNQAVGSSNARLEIRDFGMKYCAWNTLATNSRIVQLSQISTQVQVEVVALDDFLVQQDIQPDFIKIDAENFEADVIQGLAATLRKKPAKVLMETGSAESLQAGKFLLELGLRPHVTDGKGGVRLWPGELAEANDSYKDILFLP